MWQLFFEKKTDHNLKTKIHIGHKIWYVDICGLGRGFWTPLSILAVAHFWLKGSTDGLISPKILSHSRNLHTYMEVKLAAFRISLTIFT